MNELAYIFVSLVSFAFGMIVSYISCRKSSPQDPPLHDGRNQPLYMDHTHGGDADDL